MGKTENLGKPNKSEGYQRSMDHTLGEIADSLKGVSDALVALAVEAKTQTGLMAKIVNALDSEDGNLAAISDAFLIRPLVVGQDIVPPLAALDALAAEPGGIVGVEMDNAEYDDDDDDDPDKGMTIADEF